MSKSVYQFLALVIVILLILTLVNWLFSAIFVAARLLMYLFGIGLIGWTLYRIFSVKKTP